MKEIILSIFQPVANKVCTTNYFSFDILELLSIEQPNEYEREMWQLSDNERYSSIKEFRESGNEFYRNGKIEEAEEKYRAALAIIEQLLIKYVLFLNIYSYE